jgi:hypothetical protein
MQNYSFRTSVRIWHPSIDPDLISTELGLQPRHSAMAGQPRRTPKGRPLDGVYSESYWWCEPWERGEVASTDLLIEDSIAEVVELLSPHKAFLNRLRAEGGRILLWVSSYSNRNYAFEVPPELLRQCADLTLTFAHDVFPVTQNS